MRKKEKDLWKYSEQVVLSSFIISSEYTLFYSHKSVRKCYKILELNLKVSLLIEITWKDTINEKLHLLKNSLFL